MRFLHYRWLVLLLLLLSEPAWAGGIGIAPASHDLFGQMLEQIVGHKTISTLTGITGHPLISGWKGSIVSILAWINSIVLFIGGTLASYTIFGSIIKTAKSGEVMGNWHEHTVPVRTLLGAAVLLPVPGFSGLSAIQLIVIWLFGFIGVGAADTGWNVIIPNLENNSLGTLIVPRQNVRQLAGSVLAAQVCEDAVNTQANDVHLGNVISRSGPTTALLPTVGARLADNSMGFGPVLGAGFYQPVYSQYTWGTQDASFISQFMPLVPAAGLTDVCGNLLFESSLKYTDGHSETTGSKMRSAIYAANANALPTLLSSMHQVSSAIAKDKTPSSAEWNNAINAYETALTTAARNSAQQVFAAGIKKFSQAAKKYGFATAGEWYWKVNEWNQAAEQSLNQATADNMVMPSWGQGIGHLFSSHYRAEMKRAETFLNSAHSTALNTGGQPTPIEGGSDTFGALFTKAGVATVEGIVQASPGENPITHVQNIGTAVETFAGTLFTLGLAAIGVGAGVDHSILSEVGLAAAGKPAVVLGTLITHIAMLLFGLGFLLSFVIPLIPYLIWTITLITTLILFVEMVAAAPIWAVMHMHPEGHEFFGYGSTGYMLATTIVFRPLLMLVGFLAGTGIVYAVAWILNATLGNAILSALTNAGGGFMGPMDFMGMVILYTGLLIIFTWKAFELIYLIPDKVMRWAGSQGAQADDADLRNKVQAHGEQTQKGQFADTGVGKGFATTGATIGDTTKGGAFLPRPGGSPTPQG
jgi:conjugal transfer/type IV secretion protein DotA/TraY